MPQRKGLLTPQNTFLDTIATRFDGTHSNFVLGNAQAKDFPIVYCSDGFVELTGYNRAQIMSRCCSCCFLWGEDTSQVERDKILEALHTQTELKSELIFYKKNLAPFLCLLDIVPIKNEKGQVVLFLASHKNLDKPEISDDDATSLLDSSLHKTSALLPASSDNEDCDSDTVEEQSTAYKYQRRRSRAVLYQLSGKFESKSKSKLKFSKFKGLSRKNTVPEYKVQEIRSNKLILLHYSLFKIIWDWLTLLSTFYVAVVVPYNAAFLGARNLIACDITVEVLFGIDIVLNFRTTYVNKAGQVIYDPKAIAKNYAKGWFFLDLLAAVPFDIIDLLSNQEATQSFGAVGARIHMMKLARLVRLIRLLQKIDRYSEYSSVLLALLMSAFALCAHWLACVWYVIGKAELSNNSTRNINWLHDLSEKMESPYSMNFNAGGPSNITIYVSSLYFTCSSLTSVGFGNVSPNTNTEKIFSICTMLIGALMHAAVFGNVTAIIQRMYSRKTAYQTKNQELKDFTRVHHIPKPLKRRILEFFQTTWSINRGIDPREVMKDFPDELKGEIALHLNKEILSLSIFKSASHGCRKTLAQQIKTMFATPGEYVAYRGDAVKYIYFVCSGSLEILDDFESVVALLGKCDLFGIEINQHPCRSGYDVRSLTYCELQCLDLSSLVLIFDQYPNFRKSFTDALSDELSFNITDNSENNASCTESNSESNSREDTDLILPAISEGDEEDLTDQPKSPDIEPNEIITNTDNFIDRDYESDRNRFFQNRIQPYDQTSKKQDSFTSQSSISFDVPSSPPSANGVSDYYSHLYLDTMHMKLETIQNNTVSMQNQINDLQNAIYQLSSNFEILFNSFINQNNEKSNHPTANFYRAPLSYDNVPYVDDSPTSEIGTTEPLVMSNQESNCHSRNCSRVNSLTCQPSNGSDVHVTFDLNPTNIDPPNRTKMSIPLLSKKSNFSTKKFKSKIFRNNSSSGGVTRRYRCSNL